MIQGTDATFSIGLSEKNGTINVTAQQIVITEAGRTIGITPNTTDDKFIDRNAIDKVVAKIRTIDDRNMSTYELHAAVINILEGLKAEIGKELLKSGIMIQGTDATFSIGLSEKNGTINVTAQQIVITEAGRTIGITTYTTDDKFIDRNAIDKVVAKIRTIDDRNMSTSELHAAVINILEGLKAEIGKELLKSGIMIQGTDATFSIGLSEKNGTINVTAQQIVITEAGRTIGITTYTTDDKFIDKAAIDKVVAKIRTIDDRNMSTYELHAAVINILEGLKAEIGKELLKSGIMIQGTDATFSIGLSEKNGTINVTAQQIVITEAGRTIGITTYTTDDKFIDRNAIDKVVAKISRIDDTRMSTYELHQAVINILEGLKAEIGKELLKSGIMIQGTDATFSIGLSEKNGTINVTAQQIVITEAGRTIGITTYTTDDKFIDRNAIDKVVAKISR